MDDATNPAVTISEEFMPSEHTPLLLPSPPPSIYNLPWYRRPSPYWVLVPTFWITLFNGAFTAPFIQWIQEIVCEYQSRENGIIGSGSLSSAKDCVTPDVQALASKIVMMYTLTTSILALGSTSYLSVLSDTRGRRFALSISSLGMALGIIIMFIILRFGRTLTVYSLLIPAAIDGICGGPVTFLSVIHAYIADCTSREERNIIFGRLTAAAFLGPIIGPIIGGYLMNNFGGFESITILGSIILSCWFLTVVFLLPESNTHVRTTLADDTNPTVAVSVKSGLSKINIFGALSIMFTTHSPYITSAALPLIFIAHFLIVFAVLGIMSIFVFYLFYRFHWDALQSGMLMSFQSAARLIVLLIILPAVVHLYKRHHLREKAKRMEARQQSAENIAEDDGVAEEELHRDRSQDIWLNLALVRFGLVMEMIYYFSVGFATAGWQLFALTPFYSGASVYNPAIRSLVTNLVEPTQMGAVLGAVSIVEAAGNILGPLVFNMLYSKFVYTDIGVPFYVCSAALLMSVACVLMVRPIMEPPKRERTA